MNEKILSTLLSLLLVAGGSACGFKSDLYMPGEPKKAEQFDTESLQNLGQEKLHELQKQTEVQTTDTDGPTGQNAEQGVVVKLPDEAESTSDELTLQKKAAAKKLLQ